MRLNREQKSFSGSCFSKLKKKKTLNKYFPRVSPEILNKMPQRKLF